MLEPAPAVGLDHPWGVAAGASGSGCSPAGWTVLLVWGDCTPRRRLDALDGGVALMSALSSTVAVLVHRTGEELFGCLPALLEFGEHADGDDALPIPGGIPLGGWSSPRRAASRSYGR